MTPDYYEMTPEREAHLQAIKDRICEKIDKKYRAGQAEHGGNLWEKDLLAELGLEITDLSIYFISEEIKKPERPGIPVDK
jgi:hypothetical protein